MAAPAEKAPAPKPLPPPGPPETVYLTWQRDPARTMTVHWHTVWTEGFRDTVLEVRPAADGDWRRVPYVVPVYHVPAYPSHRAFSGAVSAAIRANWVPLFDEARVRFAFENHDHTYKVTHPLRGGEKHPAGTRYLGDGAWSVTARETHPLEKTPYLERAMTRNHVFVVTLHPDRAEFVAIDPAGTEFDRFAIPAKP